MNITTKKDNPVKMVLQAEKEVLLSRMLLCLVCVLVYSCQDFLAMARHNFKLSQERAHSRYGEELQGQFVSLQTEHFRSLVFYL